MSKQSEKIDSQIEKKRKPKLEEQAKPVAPAVELAPEETRVAPDGGDIERQAAWLQRLNPAQQQSALRSINRLQGNLHAQRLVGAMGRGRTAARAVGPDIQAKLTVSEPEDQYEQEAERVATEVVRMPAPATPPPPDDDKHQGEAARLHRAPQAGSDGTLQAPEGVESQITRMKGGGNPMPDGERAFFEERMGADFSGVRLHTDPQAAQSSQELQARAYTVGSDIFMSHGEYQPGTEDGRRLMAHELTHVVQQGQAGGLKRNVIHRQEDDKKMAGVAVPATPQTTVADGGNGKGPKDDNIGAATQFIAAPPTTQKNGGNGKGPKGDVSVAAPPIAAAPPTTQKDGDNGKGPKDDGSGVAAETVAAPPTIEKDKGPKGDDGSGDGKGPKGDIAAETVAAPPTTKKDKGPKGDGSKAAPKGGGDGKEQKGDDTLVAPPTAVAPQSAPADSGTGKAPKKESGDKKIAKASGELKEKGEERKEEAKAGPQADMATPEGETSKTELGNIMVSMDAAQTEEQGKAEGEMGNLKTQGEALEQDKAQVGDEAKQAETGLGNVQAELAQHEKDGAKFAASPEGKAPGSPQALLAGLGVDTLPIEDKKRQDEERSNELIAQFVAECAAQASSLAAMAQTIPTRIEPTLQQAKATIEASVEQANESVRAAIEQARTKAQSDADTARGEIDAKYTSTVTAIEAATQTARTSIETDYTTKLGELLNIETIKSGEIDVMVADGEKAVHTAASQMAQSARNTGAQYVAKYQAESYPEPSFFEGSDYYERKRQAKVNAAQQVSEQYAGEFEAKGNEIGGQVPGSAADVKGELTAKLDSARQAIEGEQTAALTELDQSMQNALTQASDTKTAQLQAVDESLTSTIESLGQLETSLLEQVTQTGEQQTQAVEQAAEQAQASLQQSVQESVSSLNESISELEAQARAIPAPQPAQVEQFLAQARDQFNSLYSESTTSLETQISTSGETINQTAEQATQSLGELGQQAAPQADEIAANFSTNVAGLTQSAIESFTKLETDHTTAVNERATQAVSNFGAALTQAQQDADNITKCLKSGMEGFTKDFENSLRPSLQELPGKIEKEASTAADKVQPAWKKVVAFIAVIIITVVVAVAIAALVASGVGLGLGLLLAAGIGALGGVAKGMINNWAEGEPITKNLLKNAVMGALDGMLQFVGGRFVQGLKLPDTGWKQVLVKKAVDTVSGVVTDMADLAWDGKLTWESAGKVLLNNLVKGLVSFGTGTLLDKWKLPDGSFKKYLAESGMGTMGDTVTKMTQTFLISGEPFTFQKALNILGESAAENLLTNAVQAGFDKAKVEDRLKGKFDTWFGNKPSVLIDPKTGQPFGQKPEKGVILDADGNPIRPNTPLSKLQEAYENLGKWARGETDKPHVLGPDGQPVDSKGKPIKDESEEPGVGLYGPDDKPLLDSNGKPVKKPDEQPGGGLVDEHGNPLLGDKDKPKDSNEPGVGLYGPDGKPLLDSNGKPIKGDTDKSPVVLVDQYGNPISSKTGTSKHDEDESESKTPVRDRDEQTDTHPTQKTWDDPTLTKDDFIRSYKERYPNTTLSDQDLADRYDSGMRLNPDTGRLKKPSEPQQDKEVTLAQYLSDPQKRQEFRDQFIAQNPRFQEYETWLNRIVSQHPELGNIPIEDLIALRGYTSDDYRDLNTALRTKKPEDLARLDSYLKTAASGLNQLPPYQGQVYRGTTLSDEVLAKYKAGEVVTEDAFTSTSASSQSQFPGNVNFVIQSTKGRDISFLSELPHEKEILFGPGTKFKVLRVDKDPTTGKSIIYMTEVP